MEPSSRCSGADDLGERVESGPFVHNVPQTCASPAGIINPSRLWTNSTAFSNFFHSKIT